MNDELDDPSETERLTALIETWKSFRGAIDVTVHRLQCELADERIRVERRERKNAPQRRRFKPPPALHLARSNE